MSKSGQWNPCAGIRPCPEPDSAPPPPLINQVIATADDPTAYLILSERLTWFVTHFHQGRTGPHIEPPIKCGACTEGCSARRYAYLAVLDPKKGSPRIYQLTERGVQYSPTVQQYKADLRGRLLKGFRLGKGKARRNAPAAYHVGALKTGGWLAPAFDLVFHLLRLWGYGHLYRQWIAKGRPENLWWPVEFKASDAPPEPGQVVEQYPLPFDSEGNPIRPQ